MTPRGLADSPIAFGMILGVIDSIIAAIGISAIAPHERLQAAMTMCIVMMVPGVIAGAALGRVAGRSTSLPVWRRLARLLVLAWVMVMFVGLGTGLPEFIVVACIPTTVGVLILERATRVIVPPAVPPAQAQR